MEDNQKLPPGGSNSTDNITTTKKVTKEGITLRSRSVNRLVTVSPKKGKLTKNSETLNRSMENVESDNKLEEIHADSKETSMDCEQDPLKEKEKNKKDSSMTEDFVIVIEPEKSSVSSTSPTASTSRDITNESTDLSAKPIDIDHEKVKEGGLKIKSVYSLRNRSNRINWSHALADSSDMLDDDIDSEEMENTEEEAMDLQVVQPVVIEPVPEMVTPPVADQRTTPKPLELFRTEGRKLYPQPQDTERNQRRSILHFDADDVIVIEDVPEVTWVQDGHVVLPEHHGKVKATGSRKLGTLRALLAYFAKRAPAARRLYSCTKCRMGFSVHSDWLKHRQECDVTEVNESSLIYYCNRCPSSFARHRDWVSHRKSHTVVTPKWMCDRCFKKFTSRRDLRDHRLYCRGSVEAPASNKPQFQCKVCDKSFPYPSALKVHSETHVLKHKCPICDVPFTRFYEMTKHVRADHPDVETHPCEHCGKVFDRLTMLYRHMSDGECLMFNNTQVTVIS